MSESNSLFDFQFYRTDEEENRVISKVEKATKEQILSDLNGILAIADIKSGVAEIINSNAEIPFHKNFYEPESDSKAVRHRRSRKFDVKFSRMVKFRRVTAMKLDASPIKEVVETIDEFLSAPDYVDGLLEFVSLN